MTDFYGSKQRDLQDRFDTRRLADRVEKIIVHGEISAEDKLFIETRDMFFSPPSTTRAGHRVHTKAATRGSCASRSLRSSSTARATCISCAR